MPPGRAAVVRWLLLLLLVAAPGCGAGRSFSRIAADKEARLRKLLEGRGGRVVKFQSKVDGPQAKITVAFTETAYETPDGRKEDSVTEQEYVYGVKGGKWVFVNGGFQTGISGGLVQGNARRYLSTEELWEIMTRMPE
jgi:hypothetical protein